VLINKTLCAFVSSVLFQQAQHIARGFLFLGVFIAGSNFSSKISGNNILTEIDFRSKQQT
jgi:hypothetical protein